MSVRQASSDGGIWWHLQTRDIDPSSIQLLHHLCCLTFGARDMYVVCICIIRETYNSNSHVQVCKYLFSQMVPRNIRQKTKRVQGVGLVDIGSISPAGRSWKPATESVRREGHRAPPFSATPPEFGERAFSETLHLVKITISGSRCLSCRGSCEAS